MTIATRGRDQWTVPSQTTPGQLYIVVRTAQGLTCDCKGNIFTGKCRHVAAVAEKLANETQVLAADPVKVAAARAIGMMK